MASSAAASFAPSLPVRLRRVMVPLAVAVLARLAVLSLYEVAVRIPSGFLPYGGRRGSFAETFSLAAVVAGCMLALVLYRLGERRADETTGLWALAVALSYPYAFFLDVEPAAAAAVLVLVLALLLAVEHRPWLAAAALSIAAWLAPWTLVGLVGLAAELLASRREPGRNRARDAASLLLPLAVLAVRLVGPWTTPREALLLVAATPFVQPDRVRTVLSAVAALPLAGGLFGLLDRRFRAIALMSLVVVALGFGFGIESLHRSGAWLLACLPLGALLARRPILQLPVLLVLTVAQGICLYFFVYRFPVL